MEKQALKKQLIYGASIIGLIACLVFTVAVTQVIVKQNSKPDMVKSDADTTLSLLVHALYAESRLDKIQIKAIATSQKLAGTFDSVLEMKPYPFTNLNDKADQFLYAYSSEVDTIYIEYRNNMYKVSGNVMNME